MVVMKPGFAMLHRFLSNRRGRRKVRPAEQRSGHTRVLPFDKLRAGCDAIDDERTEP